MTSVIRGDDNLDSAKVSIINGTPVTLTNQTFVDFAIPAGAKRVNVSLSNVSSNGTSGFMIQLGDRGGVETTGYLGGVNSPTASTDNTSGLIVNNAALAAQNTSGFFTLAFLTGNSWCFSGTCFMSATRGYWAAGSKTLSESLTTVRLTTVNGTDQFDAGTVNVSWEY